MTLLENFIALFTESAPWLLLGLLIAGMMKAFVPTQLMAKHLGQNNFMAVVKAALLGAPLPLCSCGVIPAALGLRRSGASKSATVSFLISTPETGVDSISVSYALLGPLMAIVRPIAAVSSAITAGLLVGRDTADDVTAPVEEKKSCCAHKHDHDAPPAETLSHSARLGQGLRFASSDLVNDIALWLLIGLGFAAAIQTWVPNEFLAQWGDGFIAFVVMALIGVPMYICATASTPIAAGLLFSGVSPGAVLVFMLAGPATNIATLGLVKKELGNRALAAYLGGVIMVAFAFGWLTNYLVSLWGIDFSSQMQHAHSLLAPWLATGSAVVLAILIVRSLTKSLFTSHSH